MVAHLNYTDTDNSIETLLPLHEDLIPDVNLSSILEPYLS